MARKAFESLRSEQQHLIYGYFRRNKNIVIPSEILNLCLEFYDETRALESMVMSLALTDNDENVVIVDDIRYLEEDRKVIYTMLSEKLLSADHVLAVECIRETDEENENVKLEKIITISGDKIEVVTLEDKMIMEEMSPSELVEYTFGNQWMLAPMSLCSFEAYRKMRFGSWKKRIENPMDESSFKRSIKIGLIINIHDHVAFPSPEEERSDWIEYNERGHEIVIPRPVKALRVWNVKERCYNAVDAHLDGAPTEDEAHEYWQEMLNGFRKERGAEFINALLDSQ